MKPWNRVWKMPFGLHKGKALADVPSDYLGWLMRQKLRGPFAEAVAREHERRRGHVRPPVPSAQDLPLFSDARPLKNDPCNCDLYTDDGRPSDEPFTDDNGALWVRCRICSKVWRRLGPGDPGFGVAGTGGRGPYFKKGGR